MRVSRVLRVTDIIVNSADVIVVNSVLDVVEVVVSERNAILSDLILSLDIRVSSLILYDLILMIDDLSK